MTKCFYVATELAKVMRFYVATELLMSRQSCLKLCRDRVRHASRQRVPGHEVFHVPTVGHDTMAQQGGTRARQRHSVAHNRASRTRQRRVRDIGIL